MWLLTPLIIKLTILVITQPIAEPRPSAPAKLKKGFCPPPELASGVTGRSLGGFLSKSSALLGVGDPQQPSSLSRRQRKRRRKRRRLVFQA